MTDIFNPELVKRVKSRETLNTYWDIVNNYRSMEVQEALWIMDNFFCPRTAEGFSEDVLIRASATMMALNECISPYQFQYGHTHNAYYASIQGNSFILFGAVVLGDFVALPSTENRIAHYRVEL